MRVLKKKIQCGLCRSMNFISIKDLPLKIDDTFTSPKILCWKCCKKKNFFNKEKCSICDDLKVCQGKFLKEGKKSLKEDYGGV